MKKAGPKKGTQQKAKQKILVSVVLDRSGSMGSARRETISGFNVYVDKLREDRNSDYEISLTQFDMNQGPELTVTYPATPLAQVKALTEADYIPRGGTPLYDAIGECIRRVVPDDKGRANIMVIITDGEENSSREFTQASVKALIQTKEKEGWTFVFLGSDINSYQVGGAVGMSVNSTSNYNKDRTGTMFANLATATMTRSSAYRAAGASAGARSKMVQSDCFFSNTQKADMEQGNGAAGSSNMTVTAATPFAVTQATGGSSAAPATFRVTTPDVPVA